MNGRGIISEVAPNYKFTTKRTSGIETKLVVYFLFSFSKFCVARVSIKFEVDSWLEKNK